MSTNKSRIFFRTVLIFSILTLISFCFIVVLYFIELDSNIEFAKYTSNNNVITYSTLIKEKLKEINADLNIIANIANYEKVLSNKVYKKEIEKVYYNFVLSKKIYDQARFLNVKGMEIIRVNYNNGAAEIVSENKLQNKFKRYYFKDTIELEGDKVFVSPLDLNIENKKIEKPLKPVIRVGKKVYSSKGDIVGVVVLNYLADNMLDKLKLIANTGTGKLFLLNKDGYYLHHPNSDREWGFMFGNNITFFHDFSKETGKLIFEKNRGQLIVNKDIFSFSTIYPLQINQMSSTGSSKPENKSKTLIQPDEYFWKVVSFVPFNALTQKSVENLLQMKLFFYGLFLLLLSLGFLLSLIWGKRLIAEEKLKQTIEDLKKSTKKVRHLEGILPLCSYCKKVRDDKGYWEQVDSYIHTHSEAQVSHSICPDCMEKYFPNIANKKNNTK